MRGYELLSVLGHGRHCTAYLATPVDTPQPLLDRVVCRVYTAGGEDFEHARQMAYLWQELDSPHCPQFLDEPRHDSGDASPAVVCSWARCGSLRELLDRRHSGFRLGEAVTVLAPVAQLLAELHRRAITHGGVSAEAIHFDQAGRPILLGWGEATHAEAPMADVVAFAELCEVVFAACQKADWQAIRARSPGHDCAIPLPTDLAQWGAGREAEMAALAEYWANVEEALFALAQPCPIEPLQPFDWGAETTAVLAEIDAEVETRVAEHRQAERPLVRMRAGVVRALGGARVAAARIARERTIRLVPGGQRTVSVKTVVISVLVGGIALTGALLATPPASVTAAPAPTNPAATESPASAERVTPGSNWSSSSGSADATTGATAAATGEEAVEGEDSLAALTALLQRRDACFHQASAGCFDDVDQQQSAAASNDQGAFAEAERTGSTSWPRYVVSSGTSPPPIQRVGDAVMIPVTASTAAGASTAVATGSVAGAAPAGSTTKPASALLVKGETGWRIREVFIQPD